jgi:hypothetical protein
MKKYTDAIIALIEKDVIIPLSFSKKQSLSIDIEKILKQRDRIKQNRKVKNAKVK